MATGPAHRIAAPTANIARALFCDYHYQFNVTDLK